MILHTKFQVKKKGKEKSEMSKVQVTETKFGLSPRVIVPNACAKFQSDRLSGSRVVTDKLACMQNFNQNFLS